MQKSVIRFATACLSSWTLFCGGCLAIHAQPFVYDLAIHNVRLFDSRQKVVVPEQTILIQADTIAAVVASEHSFRAHRTIDGEGRLVTPGFIDTHTHLNLVLENETQEWPAGLSPDSSDYYRRIYRDQYLQYGTTTVVDMGMPETWMAETLRWQKSPLPEYPNTFVTGGAMISDEERDTYMNHIEISGAEAGRRKVQQYAESGARHLKLYWRLRLPEMRAIAEEAFRHDLLLFGHIDVNVVSIQQAMHLGIRHFEHFMTLPASIFTWNEHWGKLEEHFGMPGIGTLDEYAAMMIFFFQYISITPAFETKLLHLFDQMAQEDASMSTTIHILGATAERTFFFSSFEHFPERQAPNLPGYSTDTRHQLQGAFDTMMHYLKVAHDRGVTIRIGTDCKDGGKALLSEMMLLAEAGFPMQDVLQIATWNGYKVMRLTDRYGSIEAGKKADLVIFKENPFDKYTNVLSEKVVIKDGVVQTF